MLILGIETSCDETAAAVVADGRQILSNVISSQIHIHRRYGGVVPEIAGRNHTMEIPAVVDRALREAGVTGPELDAVAVTYGGGLVGALLVGISAAKALSFSWDKPLYAVNHTLSHIAANYLSGDLTPPFLCLVVSGGHTVFLKMDTYTTYKVIARTVDDSVGEAFDKVARKLGLPYPGGPEIDRLTKEGTPSLKFTKAHGGDPYRLSYSGLKTAVINTVSNLTARGEPIPLADLAASFSAAAIAPLVAATVAAAKEFGLQKIALAGGVAANSLLRSELTAACNALGATLFAPPPVLCTDNAAMVAALAYYNCQNGVGLADMSLNAKPSGEAVF